MTKFASVFPTRMVHRNVSGFSRYLCSTAADCLPARICCRIRNRLKANTPASMPESTKDKTRHNAKNAQITVWEVIRSAFLRCRLHQHFFDPPFVRGLGSQFQPAIPCGFSRRGNHIQQAADERRVKEVLVETTAKKG